MRRAILATCGLFIASTLIGCGGASIPSAPGGAKDGPPPGTSGNYKPTPKK